MDSMSSPSLSVISANGHAFELFSRMLMTPFVLGIKKTATAPYGNYGFFLIQFCSGFHFFKRRAHRPPFLIVLTLIYSALNYITL